MFRDKEIHNRGVKVGFYSNKVIMSPVKKKFYKESKLPIAFFTLSGC